MSGVFPQPRKVGALLRCYAVRSADVGRAVEAAMDMIHGMRALTRGGLPLLSRIEVLVPTDDRFVEHDCGETTDRLHAAVDAAGLDNVVVKEVTHGDVFVGALNHGIANLLRNDCEIGVIVSKEARDHLTQENADALLTALDNGARVAGLAFDSLAESVMQGRIANTFACWDLMSLVQVGCFDVRSAMPRKDSELVRSGQDWRLSGNYGVEEIAPMIRLIRLFGPCLAPVPAGRHAGAGWKVPDAQAEPDRHRAHVSKIGTKPQRQTHFAESEGVGFVFLEGGILPDYRET